MKSRKYRIWSTINDFLIIMLFVFVGILAGLFISKCRVPNITCSQPGSYFPEENDRYVLVDYAKDQLPGNESEVLYVYADKYMGTMYLYTTSGGLQQIFYEEGSPMVYGDDTGE